MCALGKLVLFPKEGHTDLPKLVMTSILGVRILVNSYISFFLSSAYFLGISSSSPLPLGIHPLDENYYATEVIKCKDGSNSFTRDRLNDDFCDCVDGTDEPGTSACPAGKFYCRNVGSTPRFLFSSRVNDHICDCCDGSDENDDSFTCPNKCIMGGNIAYQSSNYGSVVSKPRKNRLDGEDSVKKLQGLKVVTIVQVVLVTVILAFCLFRRRAKSRRRLSR